MADQRTLPEKLQLLLAQGLGSGLSPWMPGTVGSVMALLLWHGLVLLSPSMYLLVVILASIVGVWICSAGETLLKRHDDKSIVWDEFCGLWIALFAIPLDGYIIAAGFILFRFFDILKPWPIGWLDKQVKGGLGVMLDDIVAGILTALCLHLWLALV